MAESNRSVVLLGGGLDSCLCLDNAMRESEVEAVIHFNYGQTAALYELMAVGSIVDEAGLPTSVIKSVPMPFVALQEAGHTLTDSGRISVSEEYFRVGNNVTVDAALVPGKGWLVPCRNMVFISYAISHAATIGANQVWGGWDYRTYAPCKDKWLLALRTLQQAFSLANEGWPYVVLRGHSVDEDTLAIVLERKLRTDLQWSCSNALPNPCGMCSKCVSRLKTFYDHGVQDRPIMSQSEMEDLFQEKITILKDEKVFRFHGF